MLKSLTLQRRSQTSHGSLKATIQTNRGQVTPTQEHMLQLESWNQRFHIHISSEMSLGNQNQQTSSSERP